MYGAILLYAIENIDISKNIISDNSASSATDSDYQISIAGSKNITLSHNTVTNNRTAALNLKDNARISIMDNIFAFNEGKNSFLNNNAISTNTNLFYKSDAPAHFKNSITGDPQFVNLAQRNYRLRKSSPAVKADRNGVALGAAIVGSEAPGPYYPLNPFIKLYSAGEKEKEYPAHGSISPIGWSADGKFAFIYLPSYAYACESEEILCLFDTRTGKYLYEKGICNMNWLQEKPDQITTFKKLLHSYEIKPVESKLITQWPLKYSGSFWKIEKVEKRNEETEDLLSVKLYLKSGDKRKKLFESSASFFYQSIGKRPLGYIKSPDAKYIAILIPAISEDELILVAGMVLH
jgi:hypothetical protein